MAGTLAHRRDSLVALVLAVVVASSFVAGAVGLGAAHGKADHITRNGDTLRIVVGDKHFDTGDRNITVNAKNGEVKKLKPAKKKKNETIYKVPVKQLSKPRTDLHDAMLVVKGKNGTLFTEQANLRVLMLQKKANARLTNGGKLLVSVKKALGYAGTTQVDVTLDNSKKGVDGKLRHDNDGAYLAVSLDPSNVSLPVSNQAKIRVLGRATTTVPLQSLVDDATTVPSDGGETLTVTNPLLAPGTTYTVSIRTQSGDSTALFASTVKTDGKGTLTVSNGALATAGNLTVSVYRGGNLVFEKQTSLSSDTAPMYRAEVLENGTRLKLLDNETLDAPNATVWLTNGSGYARAYANITTNRTVIDLGATNYRLHPNGSYNLILTGGTYARVNVSGDRNASNSPLRLPKGDINQSSANSSATGVLADPVGFAGDNLLFVFGAGGVLTILLVGIVFVRVAFSGGSSSGSGQTAPAGTRAEKHKLDVFVNDGGTNDGLDATVTATEMSTNGSRESTQINNGKGTLTLERGVWYVTAEANGLSEREKVNVSGNSAVDFTLGPQQVSATVTDDDGEPLPNVSVTCATDAGTRGTETPNSRGEVTMNVPLGASEVELSADHEKYESDETTVRFGDDSTAAGSLTLRRLTGGLRVRATVDGSAIPGVRVEVTPREETVRQLGEHERNATTDDDGAVAFDELLVGRYEISMAVPSGGNAFRTTSRRVEVRDGATVRESLDATFEYSLGGRDRDRIASLRERVTSLSSASGRDVAIPRYYGTVVTALLDVVERIPDEGHRFATVDEEPDAVVTALLDAAEETVRLVDDAMTTKRNTDLFGACVDMTDQRVEWTGEFDLDSLFELLDEDRTAQRQTVLEQLRRVDDRIDDERSGLAVVAPAREPWELTQEFVNSERGGDLVRGAAVVFVAGGLLDAVDELFDHEELRKRLERTVF